MAIAGGVNALLTPELSVLMCKGHFLSPDGRSKAFDAAADGYGRGEGAGVILLKKLSRAIADGDRDSRSHPLHVCQSRWSVLTACPCRVEKHN